MKFAHSVIPASLLAEIREEVEQAIILDLLSRQIKPEALLNHRVVRQYVRAAYGFQDAYRFKSLDAPVGDGESTLGELLAA